MIFLALRLPARSFREYQMGRRDWARCTHNCSPPIGSNEINGRGRACPESPNTTTGPDVCSTPTARHALFPISNHVFVSVSVVGPPESSAPHHPITNHIGYTSPSKPYRAQVCTAEAPCVCVCVCALITIREMTSCWVVTDLAHPYFGTGCKKKREKKVINQSESLLLYLTSWQI